MLLLENGPMNLLKKNIMISSETGLYECKGMEVGMIEQTWKRLDGTPVHLEVKASPTVYKNQQAELLLLIDISSRKNSKPSCKKP